MSDRIHRLKEAIQIAHKCLATHVQSWPFRGVFKPEAVWDGVVEEYSLEGHPKASTCFAWEYYEGKELSYAVVMKVPPIHNPVTAVRTHLEKRKKRRDGTS